MVDYWPWHAKSAAHMRRLRDLRPLVLAVMHGSSFCGAGCGDMVAALGDLRASMDTQQAVQEAQ